MSIKKAKNKQQGESSSKGSKPGEKEYTFPSHNITIKATSPEEARKKLDEQLGKANKGDKQS